MTVFKRSLLILFSLFFVSNVFGQFNKFIKKADKEYELFAFHLAIDSYKKALERRPDDSKALTRLADCYLNLNQMEEAAANYSKAVKQRDVDKDAYFNFGQVLKALGRYDEARQWFLFYARENPMFGNQYAESCDFAKAQLGVSSSFLVTNEFVNTSSSDFGATFWGELIVFSSSRTDIQRSSTNWSGKANNQLFLATVSDAGYLESPSFLKDRFKNEFNEGPLSFSPDGREVAFTKNNFVDGTRHIATSGMELSISLANINSNGDWVDVRPFPFNGTGYSVAFPSFSADGNALYFSSDRPDGFGGYDIYVSYRRGDSWDTPENLGPVVNSPGNEVTPFLSGDMLYFSSDWHSGFGGYDVFRAEPSGDRWTKIYHLGNSVNSPRDDYGFVYDGFRNLGYLTSNRTGGRGNEDIFRVSRSSDQVVLRVRNASDGSPIQGAVIDFSNCGQGIYYADRQGVYSFQAIQGLNCEVVVGKEDYMEKSIQINTIGLGTNKEIIVDLNKRGEVYAGRILDYTTQRPIQNVTITASNSASNTSAETTSNVDGDYWLSLSPQSNYVLRFSSPGFRDISLNAFTGDGFDRTILGIISLLPVTGYNPPDPGFDSNPAPVLPREDNTVQSGFSVQVAAMSKPGIEGFENLMDFGQVYSKEENGKYKIRVGVFESRDEAADVLRSVKSKGHRGSFIVKEEGAELPSGIKGVEEPPAEIEAAPPVDNRYGPYKIQLGAFRDTRWFDDSQIRALGVMEELQKGQLTVKYIGGLQSEGDARQVLRQAKSAGFNTAFIVINENGELRKVR